jgi:carbon monoxide dehydrogenase subunit G
MPRIRRQVTIQAPIERVFAAFDNPCDLPLFLPGVKAVSEVDLSAQRIGDSFVASYGVVGLHYQQRFTCTEYIKPTRISLRFEGAAALGTMELAFRSHTSGTQMWLYIDYKEVPGGLLARVSNGLVFRRLNEIHAKQMLHNLKRTVESTAREPTH